MSAVSQSELHVTVERQRTYKGRPLRRLRADVAPAQAVSERFDFDMIVQRVHRSFFSEYHRSLRNWCEPQHHVSLTPGHARVLTRWPLRQAMHESGCLAHLRFHCRLKHQQGNCELIEFQGPRRDSATGRTPRLTSSKQGLKNATAELQARRDQDSLAVSV